MSLWSRLSGLFSSSHRSESDPEAVPAATAAIVRELAPWRDKHRRPAWKPIVEPGDGSVTASKFCGTPWIGAGAVWPDCGNCKKPLQLFLQLDLDSLPAGARERFGQGLLQLFYCTRDECAGMGGWEPFADDLSRVRIVRPTGTAIDSDVPRGNGYYPGRRIVGWQPLEDWPSPAEHEGRGLKYTYHKDRTADLECPELGLTFRRVEDDMLAENVATAASGDKLAGWPSWVQGPEYPDCPRCGRAMDLLFQIDSEDHVPYMFGDLGCSHITQCAEHKDVVAFGWACS